MLGGDLEDKRRRVAAPPQYDRQMPRQRQIESCLQIGLGVLVCRGLAEPRDGLVRAVQRAAGSLVDRQRRKTGSGEPWSDRRVFGLAGASLVEEQDDALRLSGLVHQAGYRDPVMGPKGDRSGTDTGLCVGG